MTEAHICTDRCKRIERAARALILASTPFSSALELHVRADGEELHRTLREALGITEAEWRDSD